MNLEIVIPAGIAIVAAVITTFGVVIVNNKNKRKEFVTKALYENYIRLTKFLSTTQLTKEKASDVIFAINEIQLLCEDEEIFKKIGNFQKK